MFLGEVEGRGKVFGDETDAEAGGGHASSCDGGDCGGFWGDVAECFGEGLSREHEVKGELCKRSRRTQCFINV